MQSRRLPCPWDPTTATAVSIKLPFPHTVHPSPSDRDSPSKVGNPQKAEGEVAQKGNHYVGDDIGNNCEAWEGGMGGGQGFWDTR